MAFHTEILRELWSPRGVVVDKSDPLEWKYKELPQLQPLQEASEEVVTTAIELQKSTWPGKVDYPEFLTALQLNREQLLVLAGYCLLKIEEMEK